MYKAALCAQSAASVKAFSGRFKEFAAGLLATLMMHYMTLASAANSEMFLPHAQKEFVCDISKMLLSSLIQSTKRMPIIPKHGLQATLFTSPVDPANLIRKLSPFPVSIPDGVRADKPCILWSATSRISYF